MMCNKSSKDLILHLGYPKTGTTTLQNRIFLNARSLLYIGKHNPDITNNALAKDEWLIKLKNKIVDDDIITFEDYDINAVICKSYPFVFNNYSKVLLSEEGFISRCLSPTKYRGGNKIGDIYEVINKLKKIATNGSFRCIKIVIIIRRQSDLIESFFAQDFSRYNSIMGLEEPDQLVKYILNEGYGKEIDNTLNYFNVIEYLDNQFGKKNVLVMPYERMIKDKQGFIDSLSKFTGVKFDNGFDAIMSNNDNSKKISGNIFINTNSFIENMKKLKRKYLGSQEIKILSYLKNIFFRLKPNNIIMSDNSKKIIMDHYKNYNKKLENRVDLSNYKYY